MANNRGKQWETKVREDFHRTFPLGSIDRLYDPVGGYLGVHNISDFIAYKYPNIFYLECKSIGGNTFPLSNLKQYESLLPKVGLPGVRVGVIIWFYDHDKVIYAPISTVTKMKEDGKKSINIKDVVNYNLITVPGVKKRVYIDCDYTFLTELKEGE